MSRFNRNRSDNFPGTSMKIFMAVFFLFFALIVGTFIYGVMFNMRIWDQCKATGRTDLECTVLLNHTVTVQTDASLHISN